MLAKFMAIPPFKHAIIWGVDEGGGGGGCGIPEILPMTSAATEYTRSCARVEMHGAEGGI